MKVRDIDYWSKLGPDDKKWLNTFLDNYYDGRGLQQTDYTDSEKAASRRRYYIRRNDLLNQPDLISIYDIEDD